jgi:DNA-binding MarR family transcriptional regulator
MPIKVHRDRGAVQPFDETEFVRIYRKRFVEFHLVWTVFFIRHMSSLHKLFGDLEDALLLAAIGIGPLSEKLKAYQSTEETLHLSYGAPVGEASITNAVRLSEITGIPRQTVRRKLQSFAKRGWVEQLPDRHWRLARRPDQTSNLARDLSEANGEMLKELAQLLSRFDKLLRIEAHAEKPGG